jgi:hypothetical protein
MPASRAPLLAATIALLATAPAFADAVTYKGTLGTTPIVVELSAGVEAASGAFAGRYFYPAKGVDIPLDARKIARGKVDLAEEKPCTIKICHDVAEDAKPTPPLGAKWQLEANGDGSKVTGTWTDGGKSLAMALTRIGSRSDGDFDGNANSLANVPLMLLSGETTLTSQTSPYDFLKMQGPLIDDGVTSWGKVSFKYVTDPRTRFHFPRITSLGRTDPTAANLFLEQRHWVLSTAALSCAAEQYQGMGWNELGADAAGSLAGYEDEQINVAYLTPTLMSWTEGGSEYCGGAHPDNHFIHTNLDLRTGAELDMSRLFKGWVPTSFTDDAPVDLAAARAHPTDYQWGPDKQLADFVRAHRDKASADPANEADCGYDDLVASNLKITFAGNDMVVFTLDDLPSAIFACGYDLYQAPIAELKELLTAEAAGYFPSLKAMK